MRHYDGSSAWDRREATLRRAGYSLQFACTYTDQQPDDLQYTGTETGWELRRKLTAYCLSHEITEFQIVRNRSYHSDLHGNAVYELWTRSAASPPTPKHPDCS